MSLPWEDYSSATAAAEPDAPPWEDYSKPWEDYSEPAEQAPWQSLKQEGLKGIGRVVKGVSALSNLMPANAGPGAPMTPDLIAENQRQSEMSPSARFGEIQRDPVYVAGQALEDVAPEVHPVTPAQERGKLTKVGGSVGGFVPLVASGPFAPLTIGLQSMGEHISDDYSKAKAEGLDDNAAADRAMSRAVASGELQSGIFSVLPAPVRGLLEKYLVGKLGKAGFARWLSGRAAAAAEGGTLGASSKAGENVVEGEPVTKDTGSSAGSLALINLVLPWLREKEAAKSENPTTGAPWKDYSAPEPAQEPAAPTLEVTPDLKKDIFDSLTKGQIRPGEEARPTKRVETALEEPPEPGEAAPEPESITESVQEPAEAMDVTQEDGTADEFKGQTVATESEPEQPPDTAEPSDDPKVLTFLSEQANRARQRLVNRQSEIRFGSGPVHEVANITDWAIIGAEKLARGTVDFGRWSAEMLSEIGDKVQPHLSAIYRTSVDHLKNAVKAFTVEKSEVQRIIERESGFTKEPQPKIEVVEQTALKTVLRAAEKAGEAGKSEGRRIGRAEMRPRIEELTEKLSDSVSKARALKEYFRGQEIGGQAGRWAATAEIKEADAWLEADTKHVRDSLHSLIEDSLPIAERGRFMRMVAEATARPPILRSNPERMYQRAATVAAKVLDHAEQVHRSELTADIRKIADRAIDSPTVDIGFKKRIRETFANVALKTPGAARMAELRSTHEYMKREQMAGRGHALPPDVLRDLAILGKRSLADLPTDALQAMRDKMAMHEKQGRLKVKLRESQWEAEKAERFADLRSQQTTRLEDNPELRAQPGEKSTFALKLRNAINRKLNALSALDKAMLPIDALFDLMDHGKAKYGGWLMRQFRGPIDLAFNRTLARRDALINPVQELWQQHGLDYRNAERIGVYAACQQEGGRMRLINMGADPGTVAAILSSMSPWEMEVYHAMRRAMDSTLPTVQRLMHELYNIEVKPVKNYFPMPRDWRMFEETSPTDISDTAKPGDIPFDELATWKGMESDYHPRRTASVAKGFTKERVIRGQTPIKINAAEVFAQHIQDVAHLIETQRELKQMGELTRDEFFSEKYGRQGQKYVLDWLDTVARQGGVDSFRRLQWLDQMRRNIGLGTVGFRLASQFVHLANVPLAIWHTGGAWYFKGLQSVFTDRGQQFIKEHFPETEARSGGEVGIAEQGKRPMLGDSTFRTKVGEAAFWIARNIDRIDAQAAVMGRYLNELSQKGIAADAYSDVPFDEGAATTALARARRAVASPIPKDSPQLLSRGNSMGGNVSLARTLFQFGNIFLDQWSNFRHDFANAGVKEGNARQIIGMGATIAAVILAETGIRAGVNSLVNTATGYEPKHDEDLKARTEHEALKRFPFMGQLMQAMMYGETGIPTVDVLVGGAHSIYTAATAKTKSGSERAAVKAAGAVGQALGVPGASQAADITQKAMAPHKPPAVAKVHHLVQEWKADNKKPTKEYGTLESRLADNDISGARKEIQRLREKGITPRQMNKHFSESAAVPFTGSKQDEAKFLQQLTPEQRETYKEALSQRRQLVQRFRQAARP